MKCGPKYTWVARDKRKTAASFWDTTRCALCNGAVAKWLIVIMDIFLQIYFLVCVTPPFSSKHIRYEEAGGTASVWLESSQHWLMRSIIGCNFCCLDNLFWQAVKDWVEKVLKISKYNRIVTFHCFLLQREILIPGVETAFDMIITIRNLKPN